MAPIVLTNCKIYLGGFDYSGESNQLQLDHRAELLPDTVFNSGLTRSNTPGLLQTSFSATILHNPEEPLDGGVLVKSFNQHLFERIGASREVLSVAPVGEAEGDRLFFTRQVNGSYIPLGGTVGDLMAGELTGATADSKLIRGVVMAAKNNRLVTGNSTGLELGAIAEGKYIYSVVHVFSTHGVGGETLDVIIESDAAADFASPTTRLTHPQVTTSKGANWQEFMAPVGGGGIADTWWRAKWTIAGAAADYVIAIGFGIGL